MHTRSLVLVALLAACADSGGDPGIGFGGPDFGIGSDGAELVGTWRIERTPSPPDEGCPEVGWLGSLTVTVADDGTLETSNGDEALYEEGGIKIYTYEYVAGHETIGAHFVLYDEARDELVGDGSIGCGEGCFYQLDLAGARED